ncbi:MAG: MBL fold metallo-hydrolase [Oscillospiraceae bacterium]|nr:MBL fold metallo-hydrolase [Oscillospiraceae bacterium]
MKITFLGTGAAEGVPALYCRCDICKNAREKGGKEVRTRSQALVGDDLLIDYPPDTYAHYLAHGFDLPGITHMLITHSHTDHFYPNDLEMRLRHYVTAMPKKLHLYGNEKVHNRLREAAPDELGELLENLELHRAVPFLPLQVGGYKVTPMAALHDRSEECLFYLIEQGGKSLLYANDTGFFPEKTWECLKESGVRLGLCSLDCTAMGKKEGTNHMGLEDCIEVKGRLLKMGIADDDTVFVLHHFSHNGGLTHTEMEKRGAGYGFLTAYDGMSVKI